MLERFLNFIRSHNLIKSPGSLLLGISGGIDSMAMLRLFIESGHKIAAAHCNFKLRGADSEKDREFVAGECRKYNVDLHLREFDTTAYSKEKGVSLQMAARDLRYDWFNRLSMEKGYNSVAIAHNKNDIAETFLLNLSRGTGIRGLSGIKASSGKIIRPLLFASRKDIADYASENRIAYREDASNKDIKYRRNRIRHRIIPEFESISETFVENIYETAGRLCDVEKIYQDSVNIAFSHVSKKEGEEWKLDIKSLLDLSPLPSYLYEFLRRWNFPGEMINDIVSSLEGHTGKVFFSGTHRLIKDREYLIVTPRTTETLSRFYIDEETEELHQPMRLKISTATITSGFRIPANRDVACLDRNLLHFPLILRKWQKGDYFQPLGLNGLKKLSDFFIDNKLSLAEKERVWLLASGNKVVWVAGYRIDDRFKITERTKDILMIRISGQ